MAFSGMLTVFFYARLWRRAGVLTDVEFAELRYSGKPATFLRGFRALYLGLPINLIIMGWVNLAIVKIMMLVLGISKVEALIIAIIIMFVTASISTLSGLWGVLWTDLFQFVLKMGMVIVLAVFAVNATGGLGQLKAGLVELDQHRAATGSILSFLPDLHSTWMPLTTFFVYIAVNWWASWYPGAEPGGGGYVAQRIFSAKNEKHSLLATLWFNVAHYALRPWPWIIAALVAGPLLAILPLRTCADSCLQHLRQHTCPLSARSSIGVQAILSATSIAGFWRKIKARSIMSVRRNLRPWC